MSIRISAIVCTHNRAAYLKKAIESLINQTMPKEQYEVIVVDNGSTDDTRAVVESYRDFQNLRYIYEPILGLSQARNTGWRNAHGEYVAYLDDDAVAHPDWLASLLEVYDNIPEAWAVGGKVEPIWDGERPSWLKDVMLRSLSIVEWGEETRPLKWPERIIGTNCSFRRLVFSQVGLFATNLGRRAMLLLGNEDTEIQERIHELGKLVLYTPQAVVYHHVPTERLTKGYFYSRAYGSGRSQAILTLRQGGDNTVLRQAIRIGIRLPYRWLGLARLMAEEDSRFGFVQEQASQLGFLYQAVRLLLLRKDRGNSEVAS